MKTEKKVTVLLPEDLLERALKASGQGIENGQSNHLEAALSDGTLVIPSPVLFEILSAPGLTREAELSILDLPMLEISEGYWQRAGALRRALSKKASKHDRCIA